MGALGRYFVKVVAATDCFIGRRDMKTLCMSTIRRELFRSVPRSQQRDIRCGNTGLGSFRVCSAPLMLLHMTSYCIIRITSAEILPRRIKSWSSSSGLDAQRSMRATGPPRRTLEKLPFRMIRVPGVPGVHVVLIRTFNKGRRIRRRVSLASYRVGTATLRFGLGHIFLFRRVVCARSDQSRYPQRLLGRC